MYLKSVKLRGFKSFAKSTDFEFEPGITAVVGPNGSGKSNVVDALSWVMGEQGAKTLRGQKMEDVIFAGTSQKSPLGRAQVTLTIDNSDGVLPIEYSEVSISRTLFRTGASQYEINGRPARLLDIQELLSDSGLGRQQHSIIGQGQLDRVLQSTPEERRGFIEEAAGIVKHQKRKEKALKKLDAMQANVTRAEDLVAEISKQLTPLGRQAKIAKKAQRIQFDVRDAKARLLADELVQLRLDYDQDENVTDQLEEQRQKVHDDSLAHEALLVSVSAQVRESSQKLQEAQEQWYQLSSLSEKVSSAAQLAQQKQQLLGTKKATVDTGKNIKDLERKKLRLENEQTQLNYNTKQAEELLDATTAEKKVHERAISEKSQLIDGLLEGRVVATEKVSQLSHKVSLVDSEINSLNNRRQNILTALTALESQIHELEMTFVQKQETMTEAESSEAALDARYEMARAGREASALKATQAQAEVSELAQEENVLVARIEALKMSADTSYLDNSNDQIANVDTVGVLDELIDVSAGYETAVGRALNDFHDFEVLRQEKNYHELLEKIAASSKGDGSEIRRALVSVVSDRERPTRALALPESIIAASDVVSSKDSLQEIDHVLRWVLGGYYIFDSSVMSPAEAVETVIKEEPYAVLVSPQGDMYSGFSVDLSSGKEMTRVEISALVDAASAELQTIQTAYAQAEKQLNVAKEEHERQEKESADALKALHGLDAQFAATSDELSSIASQLEQKRTEEKRLVTEQSTLETSVLSQNQKRAQFQAELDNAQKIAQEASSDTDLTIEQNKKAELENSLEQVRSKEIDQRLVLASTQEQAKTLERSLNSTIRAIESEKNLKARAEQVEIKRQADIKRAQTAARIAETTLEFIQVSLDYVTEQKANCAHEESQFQLQAQKISVRLDKANKELKELTDSIHQVQLSRTQKKAKVTSTEDKSIEELGLTGDELIENFGPHLFIQYFTEQSEPEDKTDQETKEDLIPFNRTEQEKRLKTAQSQLKQLGKVNPLALEEFSALEERHSFLVQQLQDLHKSKQDLLDIIKEVDKTVEVVFADALVDVSVAFTEVFARLFPGGEGKIEVLDPSHMLITGIDIYARPEGKKVKHLSLLSGGERSLTAIAFLVAIFKARPSPFYVMDEVEAALDDMNLGRLIEIMKELQKTSQLIIITHQKRTMEIADVLYGVSMQGDGISTVISQKLDTTEN